MAKCSLQTLAQEILKNTKDPAKGLKVAIKVGGINYFEPTEVARLIEERNNNPRVKTKA